MISFKLSDRQSRILARFFKMLLFGAAGGAAAQIVSDTQAGRPISLHTASTSALAGVATAILAATEKAAQPEADATTSPAGEGK